MTMNKLWNIRFDSVRGFYLDEEASGKLVHFRIFCYTGDAKLQQIRSGSAMTNSEFRCPHCVVGSQDWGAVQFYFFNSRTMVSHFQSEKNIGLGPTKFSTSKGESSENSLRFQDNCKFVARDTWKFDEFGKQKKISFSVPEMKRVPPAVQNFTTLKEVDDFLSESQLWSAFFAVDPLHMIENHSERLLVYVLQKLRKSQRDEIESRFSNMTGYQLKESNPVWRWRLIWGSYPVTWQNILPKDTPELDALVLSWCRCVSILYYAEKDRNFRSWWKFFVCALQHFTMWRQTQQDFVLGIHFLWPHSVEQFWYVSFRTANTESHEATWKMMKGFWGNSSASPYSLQILFSKWVARQVLKGNIEEVKTRKSTLGKNLAEWKEQFPKYPDKQTIKFSSEEEVVFIHQYLKKKEIGIRNQKSEKGLFQKSEMILCA